MSISATWSTSRDSHPDAAPGRSRNPKRCGARGLTYLFFVYAEEDVAIFLVATSLDGFAILRVVATADPG
jgi:hypothetical protein